MINKPFYSFTGDADWASEACLQDYIEFFAEAGVVPTIYATNESPVLRDAEKKGQIEIGLHPNFLPGSSHGNSTKEVLDSISGLYPKARSFRSHRYFENTALLHEIKMRGIKFDSNLCLHLQANIVPLALGEGITRFPVFWEDDVHWIYEDYTWNFNQYREMFFTPGLKIMDIHPIHLALNTPMGSVYEEEKKEGIISTINKEDILKRRHKGEGVRTFVAEMLKQIKAHRGEIHTMSGLYELFPINEFRVEKDELKGRHGIYTDDVYKQYWDSSEKERKEFIRLSYEERNPKDIYATSRDYHMRELEILSLKQNLKGNSSILDLGCGNGYTLLELAKVLDNCKMVGVDFSGTMIDGAKELTEEWKPELKSVPEFFEADAIDFLEKLPDNSYDYVISERFIINQPSAEYQRMVIELICRKVKNGGHYLMCEAATKGLEKLNELRENMGLPEIPANSADNISSIRLEDDEFEEFIGQKTDFEVHKKLGYSNFQFISRVVYPASIYPAKPKYDSDINRMARKLQESMPFHYEVGGNVLYILKKN